ncbi:MAG: hypothetical protein U5K69_24500 [Balneolaceae bacterium]|nr:hypothetical protein [Balneolaceae bacterium]
MKERDRAALIQRLQNIRDEVRDLWDGVAVQPAPGGVLLVLSGNEQEKQIRIEITEKGIKNLQIQSRQNRFNLSLSTLSETFEQLALEGMAGVVLPEA